MLDLLAAIVSADPPSLLAWLVLAFAAGMYPVGIMLGASCSPCCGACGCGEGSLPETVTLSLAGFESGNTPGYPLCFLSFSSDYGSGASARVTAPGGDPDTDKGPISAVAILSGGSGYARIARVQPTVTASASGGTGATFSVSLNQISYEDRPAWEVASLTITNGGTGYPASGYVTFNVASGDTAEQSADAMFYSGRVAPTVTASASGSGSGASLSASLASDTGYDGRTYWYVDGISVTSGGSGYAEYDQVSVTVTDGEGYGAYAEVTSVDGSGAITGIAVYWGGEYYKSNGIIDSVELYGGGVYYRDDPTLPGEKATVNVSTIQMGPTAATASGAVLAAVIDNNTASPTFGQITAVNITNGGSNYLAYEWCEQYLDGLTVVLARSGECGWAKGDCGRSFSVTYRGASTPPVVSVAADCATFSLEATENIANCSSMSFTAEDNDGRSASVSPGGAFSPLTCGNCTGTITIAGQEVELNGPWTLFCVEINDPPVAFSPGENDFFLYSSAAYAAARATAFCHDSALGVRYMVVRVQVEARGLFGSTPAQALSNFSVHATEYNSLSVGTTRTLNTEFAPWMYNLDPADRYLTSGPTKGQRCVGGGQFAEIDSYSWNTLALPVSDYTLATWPDGICADEMASEDRTEIAVNIQCGPDV